MSKQIVLYGEGHIWSRFANIQDKKSFVDAVQDALDNRAMARDLVGRSFASAEEHSVRMIAMRRS